jgi:hypothetical protein
VLRYQNTIYRLYSFVFRFSLNESKPYASIHYRGIANLLPRSRSKSIPQEIPRQTCWSPPHSVLLVCSTASSHVLRVHIAGSAFAGMSPFTLSHHPPHPAPIPTRSPLPLVPPSTIAPAAAHIPRSQCTSYAIHRPWHRPFHPCLRPHQPSLHRSPPLPAPPTGHAIGHAPLASPSASSPARAAAQILCSQCTPRTICWSRLRSSQPCLRPQHPPPHRPTPSPVTIHRPRH